MIIKYCIVSRDADVVLRYFNVNTDDFDSIGDQFIAVKEIISSICSELHLSIADVEVYEKYDDAYDVDLSDYVEIIRYDEM